MKSKSIPIRWSEQEYNRLKLLADMYAGGNISKWIRYASLNAPRKDLCKTTPSK